MRRYDISDHISERIREYKFQKRWKIIAAVSAALTVIVTTALLMLPSITQEAGKDLTPYITSITVEKAVDNEWVAGTEFTSGDAIRVTFHYTISTGTVADTVILSQENNWEYTWENLDGSSKWQVVEAETPDGYTVSVAQEGITFVITNTGPSDTPPPPSKLP